MNKIQKKGLLFGTCFLLMFVFVSQSSALFKNNMKKANDFMKNGMYSQAISILEKAVIENLTNAEVHFLLGISYINNGNLWGANEVFASAVQLNPDYGYEIGKEYKKAADKAFAKGNFLSASSLFEKAVEYSPMIGQSEGYSFFVTLGDRTGNADYYDKGIIYAKGDSQKEKQAGYKLLKLAVQEWPGPKSEMLKRKTSELVGQEIVSKVFPPPYMRTTFEKTYTFNDAFEKKFGQIKTIKFGKDDVQVDDQIEVITKIKDGSKFHGKEIGIWKVENNSSHWVKTKNGYYTEKVKEIRKDSFIISLAKRKDIKVTIRAKRKTISVPNMAVVSGY